MSPFVFSVSMGMETQFVKKVLRWEPKSDSAVLAEATRSRLALAPDHKASVPA
jgi:hypothetical protein